MGFEDQLGFRIAHVGTGLTLKSEALLALLIAPHTLWWVSYKRMGQL